MTTITQTYETDLAAAQALLADRLEAAIAAGKAENSSLEWDLPKSLNDALNNEWIEGISVSKWADRAAAKVGI